MSEDRAIVIRPDDGQRAWMAQFDGAQSIGQLAAKLRRVVKGGDKLNDNELLGLAQTAVLHDLDPTGQSPEVWGIPGKGVYVGIEGWRKCMNRNLDAGDTWWIHYEDLTPQERADFQVEDGDMAVWGLLELASRIRLRASLLQDLQDAGMTFDAAWQVIEKSGLGPVRGLGILRVKEVDRFFGRNGQREGGPWEPAQHVRVRAERDAIRQLAGIDLDGTYLPADTIIEMERPQLSEPERKEKAARAASLLGGSEDDDYLTPPTDEGVIQGEFTEADAEAEDEETEQTPHWIDEARPAFWGWARHGLDR